MSDGMQRPDDLDYACPRCPAAVVASEGEALVSCPTHLDVAPLRRPGEVAYHLIVPQLAGDLPTLAPWPLGPDWLVSDFGYVGDAATPLATVTSCFGRSDTDGEFTVLVIVEQPGVGLGARAAGLSEMEPPAEVLLGAPAMRAMVEGQSVPLWQLPGPSDDTVLTRLAAVGQWAGRWIWVVWHPAVASLMRAEWAMVDLRGLGPTLLEVPFGGPREAW